MATLESRAAMLDKEVADLQVQSQVMQKKAVEQRQAEAKVKIQTE